MVTTHPPKTGEAAETTDRAAELRLTILGTRGSMAISSRDCLIFGGSTSCYMVQAGDDCVFLDAGSGLLSAPAEFPKPPLILLSHLHVDHLLGLGMYRRLDHRGAVTRLLVPTEEGQDARSLIDSLYAPPYWPVSLDQYTGTLQIEPLRLPIRCGLLTIEGIQGCHPGGCEVFRVSCGTKSLVYATDFEHEDAAFARLAAFARGTDLLLYDGQYDREEYGKKRGFGHSTAEKGIELMALCGAKRLLIIHHAPPSTDGELLKREAQIGMANVRFAREGEVIVL